MFILAPCRLKISILYSFKEQDGFRLITFKRYAKNRSSKDSFVDLESLQCCAVSTIHNMSGHCVHYTTQLFVLLDPSALNHFHWFWAQYGQHFRRFRDHISDAFKLIDEDITTCDTCVPNTFSREYYIFTFKGWIARKIRTLVQIFSSISSRQIS